MSAQGRAKLADKHAANDANFGIGTLVADRIWMQRFTGTGEAVRQLDAILFEDFAELRSARITQDTRIVAWIESLDETALSGWFRYRLISNPAMLEQEHTPPSITSSTTRRITAVTCIAS